MNHEPLEPDVIEQLLAKLDGWSYEREQIRRVHTAKDFPEAIRLVDAVAVSAEAANHHPDIDIRWRTVTFALSTHDAGDRVTRADIEMAEQIDAAIAELA